MPRLSHEAMVHLVRNAPEMVTDLLRRSLGVDVPLQVRPRLSAGELTDLDLAEFRADAVLTLGDPVGQVYVVEAQGAVKPSKRRAWPMYVVGLHTRWGCPVLLVVIAPRRKVAAWARTPIDLGHGRFVLHPLVLGPDEIPVITDVEQARRSPELAVLSVAAHGSEQGAERIAFAALTAVRDLDSPRSIFYPDFIHALLGDVARAALERLMDLRNYKFQSDFIGKPFYAGKAEGVTAGKAEVLQNLLALRHLAADEATRARIAGCQDGAQIDRWIARVLDATCLADVFDREDAP